MEFYDGENGSNIAVVGYEGTVSDLKTILLSL
jgi:hypothetical protein